MRTVTIDAGALTHETLAIRGRRQSQSQSQSGSGSLMQLALFLRLDVRHDYRGDGPAPVVLEPDAAKARLAGRPDLRIRLSAGMAEIFAADDRAALTLLEETGDLMFTFRLRPRDPQLRMVTATVAEARDRIIVLDPRPLPHGRLHAGVTLNEADQVALVAGDLVTSGDVARPPLAIVRLRRAATAEDAACHVRFGAVERFWTYHVIGGAAETAYGIRDRTSAMTFESLGPRTMSSGRRAQSFRSSAPIAERARPAVRFELFGDGPFGPRVIVPVLPCPRPGPGTADPCGGARTTSEIFVNLW